MPGTEAVHADGQVDSGFDVAGGVEQGTDRGGGGHCLGNPGMEGKLDGFCYQGGQHEEEDSAGEGVGYGWIGPEGGAGAGVDDDDRGQQAVACYVGH